ncbi:hypothetical protein GIB67_036725 [Kingdonia uniflora]|uniref:AMP deaminase n=1 Tax=Kingdonia uniflora TaxID=39325 RepID=A0A7J7LWH6_9MAGN|nr:hypothetical protein GIB67_036725 [Kingdonia uniflora]
MDTYTTLHLAMAALLGASFVAVLDYYMHRKTLTQLLDFTKAIDRDRDRERETIEDGEHKKVFEKRRNQGGRRKTRRGLSSLPDGVAVIESTAKRNGNVVVENDQGLSIPVGLPSLQTRNEGLSVGWASSGKRTGHIIGPVSPKSPIASASAFESVEGSDEEDILTDGSKIDTIYLHANGDAVNECKSLFQNLPDQLNGNVQEHPISVGNIILNHSVSGDLHGVQPDPVAADILRKEPEHETFARLKVAPNEVPSLDEVEVYLVLQKCLQLRESYLFREEVVPWEKEDITEPCTPKPNPNPFSYSPEKKTDHYFRMEDGVVHVYANQDLTEKLFPVADATTYFTDLHHILRVIAAGNIRTLCHHRLVLLEQKFNLHLMLNADRELLAQRSAPHRDFYNVRKVDTHVHHSACMNQKHLLRFIKSKLRKEPGEVVIFRDGTYLTLKEVFESLDLTGYDLNIDLLDVHADKSTFHRFDKFNLKYNPCGQSRLREIFLKQDNLIQGFKDKVKESWDSCEVVGRTGTTLRAKFKKCENECVLVDCGKTEQQNLRLLDAMDELDKEDNNGLLAEEISRRTTDSTRAYRTPSEARLSPDQRSNPRIAELKAKQVCLRAAKPTGGSYQRADPIHLSEAGRFLAELTKQVFSDLETSKYQMAEYRISIYGRKQSEWDQLASWITNNELYSENVVWLIQLPRLYNIYKEMGIVTSFQNILDNIFLPLFEVTVDPDSHPQLHIFLKQVVGLDLVDDESKPERRPTKHMPTPAQWTNVFNPAFSYYAYYCYANLYTLNKLRELKGMTTIKFRPHSGEAGDIDHLAATFLTAHNIAHGINLRKSPVLQYLYYLAQIGLAMSPLSNNSLFLDLNRNPFPMFFLRGLNVSLSTDDPLQIHLTKEPLVEEYSIAASVWKLSSCDLCEIARNSVYQSGFSHALKSHWIGKSYYKRGPNGNDIHKTNVPHIRVEFRNTVCTFLYLKLQKLN